ncbi:probable polygalacturonase [Andrographis paniculata]|uniref:probable polygalacturonase n=1 Tax=Andrographis paniculata TaxID=175694 RepID=UPI0021E965A9|nr:probable polygalacturonase [Andrographis paniculata]XP_051137463.1 probable polygalacturonase [Andrographis paniculata]XP_051137464.1 probable polygalacturonase [Andrographis paniculata]XP_051137465.1 probable polygalacturonase [Andrographis paniculata]
MNRRDYYSIWLCFGAVTILSMHFASFASAEWPTCSGMVPVNYRNDKISITDYGGVGDGVTLNTKAFRAAIYRIEHLKRRGGTLLYIPPGEYLTGPFNLTSRMTLYLARGAVIKATMDSRHWPVVPPLPSYGRGRERPGGRYMSFIHGDGLHDVIITGENGTIDGQGGIWWNMWRLGTLLFTRPNLIELMNSRDILISNVVFKNSPFWNIHPVYCSNVVIRYVTILAPSNSPNTDGIDPDSSSHVCIEDSHITTGDDLVAVKSGWDEYGIAYGRPSHDITIRRITGSSPFAGIAIGSETSGGIQNIVAEHINLFNVGIGIHLKTNIGRGGVIRNITFSNIYMQNARKGVKISGDVGDHPDEYYNTNALPIVKDVTVKNVWGDNVQQPGLIHGLRNAPFTGICLSNIHLRGGQRVRNSGWQCSDVSGGAVQVSPWPCSQLTSSQQWGACSSSF